MGWNFQVRQSTKGRFFVPNQHLPCNYDEIY